MSIPTICDRCRSTGIAGEGDFSHLGDLLDFTPVPVQPRVNGWDPDAQRAFIALLATTGSKSQAAKALGRNAHGIDQLLKREDSGSFRLAFDRAMAIARANGSMKIAQGVADAAARNAQLTPPSRLRDLPAPAAEEEEDSEATEEYKLELLQGIAGKFMRKVAAERRARLAGEIVAADFYLRQVTIIEVIFDLTSTSFGLGPREVLHNLRRARHGLLDIVDTPFAQWLDRQRREWWLQEGEPDRPPHPDARFIERHRAMDGEECSTYVDQNGTGATTTPARGFSVEEWSQMNGEAQRLARQKQFDEDAEEQRAYERRAFEEWQMRQSDPPRNGEWPPL